jgi:multidrug transporter EmrE-like cation transporter
LVFITFGLVTARVGVAVGAGTLDSLLSLSTIIVGLLFFKDHKQFSAYQYWGLAFISAGIILMQFSH